MPLIASFKLKMDAFTHFYIHTAEKFSSWFFKAKKKERKILLNSGFTFSNLTS